MKPFIYKLKEMPFVSIVLVAINIIIYLLCTFGWHELYDIGCQGVYHVLVEREYGRMIWSMFLHGNLNHLFNNMLILCFLGAMIEKDIGHIRFALLYFLSGIGGNVLSLLVKSMSNDWSVSIGASGAVFGLDGVLLSLVLFSIRKPAIATSRVIFVIAYSLYTGLTGHNIDNAAHIGGLLTGFMLGAIICIYERVKYRNE